LSKTGSFTERNAALIQKKASLNSLLSLSTKKTNQKTQKTKIRSLLSVLSHYFIFIKKQLLQHIAIKQHLIYYI